ncbi:PAQR family membrane homeostasis protein TrhA [Pelagibacterium montanilacus]|uniref:PAQR family membrane homeostasis protein TrhA n=1 Tax=Pelagibacterium montanilacus TaxID=2185280 RepID=UPI000F8D8541|nr:hemolysin III family protein [Pelagibacterium montanilacus]
MAKRPHYPSAQARSADLFVHLLGLGLAIVGGGILLWMSIQDPAPGRLVVIAIYSLGAVSMFGFSTAYNFATAAWKPILRRLDHVGIFLMIAATYTPFTAYLLSGAWAWWLTTSLWVLASLGMLGKILSPPIGQKLWVSIYLGLAWIGAIAVIPLANITSGTVLWLLAIGGIFYTVGVLFYTNKRLQFAKAIWHGHVVAAATTHWAAVLMGLFVVHS